MACGYAYAQRCMHGGAAAVAAAVAETRAWPVLLGLWCARGGRGGVGAGGCEVAMEGMEWQKGEYVRAGTDGSAWKHT